MAMNRKALNSYHSVHLASSAPYADGVQLIQMLFDGLIDTLSSVLCPLPKARSSVKIFKKSVAL